MKSDIVYTKDTLIVKLYGVMDKHDLDNLKRKLYRIITDYKIDNIILNIGQFDQAMFKPLIDEYYNHFTGHLTIKKA